MSIGNTAHKHNGRDAENREFVIKSPGEWSWKTPCEAGMRASLDAFLYSVSHFVRLPGGVSEKTWCEVRGQSGTG